MNKVAKVFIVTSDLSTATDSREKSMADLAKTVLESCQAQELSVDLLNLDQDTPSNFFQATKKDSIIIEYQIRFQRADLVIFIYPIKLGQVPSRVKFFLESILSRGFSYKVVRGQIQGLFDEKEIWAISITDLPSWKVNTIWGNGHKNWWQRVVKEYSGSTVKTWVLSNWRSVSEDNIITWKEKFNKIITNLNNNNNNNLFDLI
jgi:putative NADPH-quinone reductase